MTSVHTGKFPKEHPNTTVLISGYVEQILQEPFDVSELWPVIKFSFTETLTL
jgi:hypothetical protein